MENDMNILMEIAEKTKERVEKQKLEVSEDQIKALAKEAMKKQEKKEVFYHALRGEGIQCICEVKKASPSKGIIAEEFPYVEIAKDYETGGAGAISVLTEPFYFFGSNEYLKEIRKNVSLPILRKDFTVDDYQIYEAKVLGADACLLIVSLMSEECLKHRLELAHSLNLSALVETHDEKEVEIALRAGAKILGVNNRNLKDFSVDVQNSSRLRKSVPPEVVFVSESGISNVEQVKALKQQGVDAVLVGEMLMRAKDRVEAVKNLKAAGR